MQLTSEELIQFNTDGFIVLRGFVKSQECNAILDVAQQYLQDKIEPIETELGYDSRSKDYRTSVRDYDSKEDKAQLTVRRLRQVYGRHPLFKAWMEDKELRPILQQVLNDQVVLTTAHHNSIMTKMPYFSKATAWHQDRRYWRYSDNNLVSVWLALDNENSQNGVLEFIPGSHTMHFDAAQFDEKEYFSETNVANHKIIATKVSTELRKGDVVLFHSLLLHRANRNSTETSKLSFVYTVKGKDTEAIAGTRSAAFPEIILDEI